ncbi:hypothetical protein KX729_02135 [Rhizobium sp. XQZ8]|uniref:hypothetical protein n=1 Tax=Rhizobium populisoli TaxID=2859785 RepID=UPI001CA596B9|nr:hypothetical protein [Rhizobium populisoli]MBW6420229.1 hypothetical protein [Rhizobium populisoli]
MRVNAALFVLAGLSADLALAADDDQARLQAYSSLLTGAPPSMAMDGEIKPGRQINLTNGVLKFGPKTGQRFASGDLLSLGPGQCIVQKLMISQGDKDWAQTSLITYDFSRVQKLRYLADDDDYEKAESRKPDDPKVTTIWIEGDNLHCQQVMHIDPAKPQHFEVCEKSWTVILTEPDDKKAAMAALDMIGARCFKK